MSLTRNSIVPIRATRLIVIFVVIYLAICAGVFIFQRSLIYFPQPRIVLTHEVNLKLPIKDGNVLVSIREHTGDKAIIYFGGNAEDVSLNLPDFSSAFSRHAIYLLHYRGYGGSAGQPSETALVSDGLALFDKVALQHKQIVIIGRSLGSGIAIQVASLRSASQLILVTPYNSIQELAVKQFPYFPVSWLLQDKYESWRYAPGITVPTLFLVAEDDTIVPRESSLSLYKQFTFNVASLKILAHTSHNTMSESPQYLQTIKDFLS